MISKLPEYPHLAKKLFYELKFWNGFFILFLLLQTKALCTQNHIKVQILVMHTY